MTDRMSWGHASLCIEFAWAADAAPALVAVSGAARSRIEIPQGLPLVDVLTVAAGHAAASDRLVHSEIGESLRYVSHVQHERAGVHYLDMTLFDQVSRLTVVLQLSSPDGVAAFRSEVRVRNDSEVSVAVRSVTSWSSYLGHTNQTSSGFDRWTLVHGLSDWLAEGRWQEQELRGPIFPATAAELTGHNPRGELSFASTGTWSTGKFLPVAGLVSQQDAFAWVFEIEHNGAWRWEVGEDTVDGYFAISGPTDIDHQFTRVLAPGDTLETVPATIAAASDFAGAMGELTKFRRRARRPHPDNTAMPIVFNDYMNTLNGDPTTERLIPLIDAAASVGAEVFCIDAGWYDDGSDWWDSVGEWIPSTTRFSGGLGEVVDQIRRHGMTPGLWLEPEVVGVRSPMADRLPAEAFLSRYGERIVEQGRYHLDLRNSAAIDHLNGVVDRLIAEFGIGYFKLDYNINPGSGPDRDADSVGAALLEHNRAHLAWIDSVLDRHPNLVLENCASGAMRMDFAMLSRMQLQSTSDQQDFLKYPPIAASAPLSMLPEQAANWAYPQPEMSTEEAAFALATGLLGRFYVSGYLNRMTEPQIRLVSEAITVAKDLRADIQDATPFWPLGLPGWTSPWTALGLATQISRYITIWNRSTDEAETILHFPDLAGAEMSVRTVFPQNLDEWDTRWDSHTGKLYVNNPTGSVGARTVCLERLAPAGS